MNTITETSHIEYLMSNIHNVCKFGTIVNRVNIKSKPSYIVDIVDTKTTQINRFPLDKNDYNRLQKIYEKVIVEHDKIRAKQKRDKEEKRNKYKKVKN